MKTKLNILHFSFLLSLFIFPSYVKGVIHPTPDILSSKLKEVTGSTAISLDDIIHLNAKEFGKKRGKKLKLKERLGFFIMKKEIKRARKKGKSDAEIIQALSEPNDSGQKTANFLLGFFLGLVGVLIAYLAFKDNARYAWYGLLAVFGILLLTTFYGLYGA